MLTTGKKLLNGCKSLLKAANDGSSISNSIRNGIKFAGIEDLLN